MTEAPLPVTGSIPVARGALVAVVVTRGVTPCGPRGRVRRAPGLTWR